VARALIRKLSLEPDKDEVEIVYERAVESFHELAPERERYPTAQAARDAHPTWPWREPTPQEFLDAPPDEEVLFVAEIDGSH
jgi:hypothetical protein